MRVLRLFRDIWRELPERSWGAALVWSVCLLAGALVTNDLCPTATARADSTRLLEVDFKTGAHKRIDASGPKTEADNQLDALLDAKTGGPSFNTSELERIEKALRQYLQANRPRAIPRLLLFLYPGRVSRSGLQELRDIQVDLDMLVDPCSRTVCREAVATYLELLGRTIKQSTIKTTRYTVRFVTVTIRAATDVTGAEYETFRYRAEDVVQAGLRPGGGKQLVSRLMEAQSSYVPTVIKEINQRVKARRVRLATAPQVQRDPASVNVSLEIDSDRIRYRRDVLETMLAAVEALRKNPLTPASNKLQVVARVPMRKIEKHTFNCLSQPLGQLLDGRLSQEEIWSTYLFEKKNEGTQMSFSDAEARGGGGGGESNTDETDEAPASENIEDILAAHFDLLAPCISTEAARDHNFKGATMQFAIAPDGKAGNFRVQETRASAALRNCLQTGLGKIKFPRSRGAFRQVTYPMLIER